MYKNYFFDLYGTFMAVITNEESEEVWNKMTLYYGYYGAYYEEAELKNRYKELVHKFLNSSSKSNNPEIDVLEVFYKLFLDKGVKPKKRMSKDAAKVFRLLTTNHIELFEGVIDLLETLKSKGKKTFILANAQNVYALYEMRQAGIRRYFEDFFFSSDFGMCKPDPSILETIFDEEKLKKKESMIISADYDKDIVPASRVGIDTLYIRLDHEKGQEKSIAKLEVSGRDFKEITKLLVK